MKLESRVRRGVRTRAPIADVYALLADVPRSAAHFPEVERVSFEDGAYVWRMKKLGAGPISFQVVYAARYSFEPEKYAVSWVGVPGFGNTLVSGRWEITPRGVETEFALDNHFVLDAPFPSLMRGAAEALMTRENDRLIAAYLAALKRTLDG